MTPRRTDGAASDNEAEGWEVRAVVEEIRAGTYVETYEEMGYEVRLLPADPPDRLPECTDCFVGGVGWVTVQVRRAD